VGEISIPILEALDDSLIVIYRRRRRRYHHLYHHYYETSTLKRNSQAADVLVRRVDGMVPDGGTLRGDGLVRQARHRTQTYTGVRVARSVLEHRRQLSRFLHCTTHTRTHSRPP